MPENVTHSRISHQIYSIKKVLLKISQNLQENTYVRASFFIKLQALSTATAALLKKRLWHRCSSVNFAIFLRTPFMQNTCGRLLLPQVEEESKRVRRNFYLIHLIIFLPEMFKYLSAAFQDLIDNNLWIYIQKQNCAFHFWLLNDTSWKCFVTSNII